MTATILIVEDDPVQQKLYELLCSRFGFNYRIFSCSAGAYEFLSGNEPLPDVLLIDCILRGENGLRAIKRLKELAQCRGAQLPVVAVTANAFEADRIECLESGADGYLAKPFTLDQFRQTVDSWCAQSASHAGVA